MPGTLSVLRGVRDALGLLGYTKKFITWHFSNGTLKKLVLVISGK